MDTLITILFSPVNGTLTILLILLIFYWLITMFFGLDFEVDVDIDVDVDVDVDIDADAGIVSTTDTANLDLSEASNVEIKKEHMANKRRKPLKWWQVVLVYFNFVGLPFMFAFTCWIFIWWSITTVTTTISHTYNNSLGILIMLLAFIPSLFVNKIFTFPFKKFFKNFNTNGDASIEIVGRQGICLSTIKENKMGSAEVVVNNTPLSIYIKSLNGDEIGYKDPILIIKQSANKNYYYAQLYQTT